VFVFTTITNIEEKERQKEVEKEKIKYHHRQCLDLCVAARLSDIK